MAVKDYFAVSVTGTDTKVGHGTMALGVLGVAWTAQLAVVADWFTLPGARRAGNWFVARRAKKAADKAAATNA